MTFLCISTFNFRIASITYLTENKPASSFHSSSSCRFAHTCRTPLHLKKRCAPSSSYLSHMTHFVSIFIPLLLRLTRRARVLCPRRQRKWIIFFGQSRFHSFLQKGSSTWFAVPDADPPSTNCAFSFF